MFISTAALVSTKVAPLDGPALATKVRLGLYSNVAVSVLVWEVVKVGVGQPLVVDEYLEVLGVDNVGIDVVLAGTDVDLVTIDIDDLVRTDDFGFAEQYPSDPHVPNSVQHSFPQHVCPFRHAPP